MTRTRPSAVLVAAIATVVAVLTWSLGIAQVAAAPPRSGPGVGSLVTITVTSDQQVNDALVWFDANGRIRHQSDVSLADHDANSGRWSASMTFTRAATDAAEIPAIAVFFTSGGEFAHCTVHSGTTVTSQDTDEGAGATVSCRAAR